MQPKKRKKYECQRKRGETKCLGSFSLAYEENLPIFVCDKCGYKDETWKRFYTEYLNLYREKSNWEEEKNYISCVLGLFCHEYKKKYNIDYTFVPKNPNPYSEKECKDVWIMLGVFNKNALEVRKYIIWAFHCGMGDRAKITSLAYLNSPGLIRKYKLWAEKSNTLRRESPLPKELIDWCRDNAREIFEKHSLETMNDLGALFNYVKAYLNGEEIETKVIRRAIELGLIKDNKMNIGR